MATFWTPSTSAVNLTLQRGPIAREVKVAATYGVPIDTGTDTELTALLRRRRELREGPLPAGPVNIVPNPVLGSATVGTAGWSHGSFGGETLISPITRVTGEALLNAAAVDVQWQYAATGSNFQVYPSPTVLAAYNDTVPGEAWSMRCWVRVIGGASEISLISGAIGFKTAANAYLGSNGSGVTVGPTYTGGWQLVTCNNAVAPATAGMVFPFIIMSRAPAAVGGVTIDLRVSQATLSQQATALAWDIGGRTYDSWLGTPHNSPSVKWI